MASEIPTADGDLETFEFSSYIRGYHVYKEVWMPAMEEMLLLRREPTNETDRNAVAVLNEDGVVGHVPFNLAPVFSSLLRRELNKGFAKVTGQRINRGAGYVLEIPCQHILYGPKLYIVKLKELVTAMMKKGII